MSARILLHVDTGLAPEEVDHLKQILRDAFGEFIGNRSGNGPESVSFDSAIAYVTKRYPEMGVAERARKADEVMLRKAIARKLRRAADEVIVDDAPDLQRVEETLQLVEAAFVAGNRAAEAGESLDSSPHPTNGLLHHWWTRGFSYCARLLRAIEAEQQLKAVPVAERTCVVLPTVFPQSVEEEAKLLHEALADAKRDEGSPLAAYAQPRPVEPPEIPFETFRVGPRKRDE